MKQFMLSISLIAALLMSAACTSGAGEAGTQMEEDLLVARETIDTLNKDLSTAQSMLKEKAEEMDAVLVDLKNKDLTIGENGLMIESLTEEKQDLEEEVSGLLGDLAVLQEEVMTIGPTPGASLLTEATQILSLMQAGDFPGWSAYVDPGTGVRVSPYQYVDTGADVILTQSDVSSLASYPVTNWGAYDGSGDPINISGMDYYNAFIYDEDYLSAPYIGQNVVLSSGNMINNIASVYTGASTVEFYFDMFNPAYSGMDWKSITLVMQNTGGQWYLIGIIHGQWTI